MKAGRELDALVAEKVMGWEVVTGLDIWMRENSEPPSADYVAAGIPHMQKAWFVGNERKACQDCGTMPAYSADIAAAWEVVEKLNLLERYTLGRYDDGLVRGWAVQYLTDDDLGAVAVAESAPLAICLAALKAVGL